MGQLRPQERSFIVTEYARLGSLARVREVSAHRYPNKQTNKHYVYLPFFSLMMSDSIKNSNLLILEKCGFFNLSFCLVHYWRQFSYLMGIT